MSKLNIENNIKEDVEALGYEIEYVEYVKEGDAKILRVVIDKEGLIDIDDCICVTKLIDPMLDETNYITDSYILDVCSKEKGSDKSE